MATINYTTYTPSVYKEHNYTVDTENCFLKDAKNLHFFGQIMQYGSLYNIEFELLQWEWVVRVNICSETSGLHRTLSIEKFIKSCNGNFEQLKQGDFLDEYMQVTNILTFDKTVKWGNCNNNFKNEIV